MSGTATETPVVPAAVVPPVVPAATAPATPVVPAVEAPPAEVTPVVPKEEASILGGKADQAEANAVAPVVPEKYEAFKLPEGVTLDAAKLESAVPMFKELGLTQDNAQKLVDYWVADQQAQVAAQERGLNETIAGMEKDLSNDPDVGGLKFNENVATVQQFIGRALGKDAEPLRAFFNTPLGRVAGSNKHLFKLLHKCATATAEDAFAGRSAPVKGATTQEQQHREMYPSMYNEDGTPKSS